MSTTARFVVYVRKSDVAKWLPIGCPNRDSADAMIAHCLGESGEYDVARVTARIPGLDNVYVETGERHTRKIVSDPPLV